MLPNGEFSVTNVWRHNLTVPATDVIKEMKSDYAAYGYTDEEIESWVTRLVSYDGKKLFFPYDRHSGQFRGYAQQPASGSKNADGVFGKAGNDGETVLEISSRQSDGGDTAQNQQRHKVLTNREVLEMVVDEPEVSDLTPGERSALDIYKSS